MSSFFLLRLKKSENFCSTLVSFPSFQFLSHLFWRKIKKICHYQFSLPARLIYSQRIWRKSWLFSWIAIFRRSCGSHIVHMQKIRNRSNFFQKIFQWHSLTEWILHFSNILCANSPNSPNYPLPGLFPKSPPLALFLSNFFQKIFILHHWLSEKVP